MNENYMKLALDLAAKGAGHVSPNPMVGAVLVKDDRIIGQGWHRHWGGPHAEVNAIVEADEDPAGSDLYVTLEPCCHHGKTPPCTNLIVTSGIRRVLVAMEDPNPLVAGKGIQELRLAGIEVEVGMMKAEAQTLNRFFIKSILEEKPYVILKTAMSMDGKTTNATGGTCRISGTASNAAVHQMRHEMDAIMVGIGTLLADDPKLTTRRAQAMGQDPIPVIIDPSARIPADAAVFTTHQDSRLILVIRDDADASHLTDTWGESVQILPMPHQKGRFNLTNLMSALYQLGITSLLLEGGSDLNASALEAGIVDEVIAFVAPKIIGGTLAKTPVAGGGFNTLTKDIELQLLETKPLAEDVMIRWKVSPANSAGHR